MRVPALTIRPLALGIALAAAAFAVAGLRLPVGGEHHFFLRLHGEGGAREGEAENERAESEGGNAHGNVLLWRFR